MSNFTPAWEAFGLCIRVSPWEVVFPLLQMFTVRKYGRQLHCFSHVLCFLFASPPFFYFLHFWPAHPNRALLRKSDPVMLLCRLRGQAEKAMKRFRGFNEDLGWWEVEPGAVGIVSSAGMLPPATVTSPQHSFPQSWNNRDPHHSPHLLFPLSHTFLPRS